MTTENPAAQVAAEVVAETPPAPAAPQYLTMEQVQTLLSNQTRAFERQISGVTSKIDTGLNAIRRDTQSWAQQQVQVQTAQQRKDWLAGLSEEGRAVAEPLLKEIDKARQPAQEVAPESQADAPPAQPDPWAKVYELVEDYGLKRDAQGIDYAAFTDPDLTDRQRQQRFMGSLRKVAGTSASAPAPAAPRVPASPPPPESPRGGGGGYASMESLRDAYITGKLTVSEYRQTAQSKFGESV
mgnify:CR=1 FL=1